MIQLGTILKVTDKTGVVLAQCIKILGASSKKRIALIGDVILISVKWINPRKFLNVKERKKKQFAKGTLHRALIIRSKVNFIRTLGVYLKFDENSIVLVTKNVVPLCNRVYGPVLKEFCMRWPSLGCVSRCIL